MANVTNFLNKKGYYHFEGYSQQVPEQVKDLIQLTRLPVINVMEIGFNAGHSAEVFLSSNSKLQLTSFDLGEHNYVRAAKEYIDKAYPGRHKLILGDSRLTIPKYILENRGKTFDVIFIDGGHDYEIAKADLINCSHLANPETIVILDDTVYTDGWERHYSVGPTKMWTQSVEQNKISELARKDYCEGRGMSWGKYVK